MATNEQRQKRGAKQLKKKLTLERKLGAQIRRFFKEQNKRFLELRRQAGITLDAESTKAELQLILTRHYRKSAGVFVPLALEDINRALKEDGQEQITIDNPAILGAMLFFISRNVFDSANAITATSNAEIANALAKAEGDAEEAYKLLQKRNLPRSELIAVTETQKATEGSKQLAAEEAQPLAAIALAATIQTVKVWTTRMDGKVRDAHVAANFPLSLLAVSY
jgi:hypothetical protein